MFETILAVVFTKIFVVGILLFFMRRTKVLESKLQSEGKNPYVVPVGGSNVVSCLSAAA